MLENLVMVETKIHQREEGRTWKCNESSRRFGNRQNRPPKKDVTAMDLDADMDAYMAAESTAVG